MLLIVVRCCPIAVMSGGWLESNAAGCCGCWLACVGGGNCIVGCVFLYVCMWWLVVVVVCWLLVVVYGRCCCSVACVVGCVLLYGVV